MHRVTACYQVQVIQSIDVYTLQEGIEFILGRDLGEIDLGGGGFFFKIGHKLGIGSWIFKGVGKTEDFVPKFEEGRV